MFPTLFGATAATDPDAVARSEAILTASLAVADRGEQVRSQVRGALVEEVTAQLLARRIGAAAVHRERRILFDGVPAEIHPYDVTVERDGAAEALRLQVGRARDQRRRPPPARRRADARRGRGRDAARRARRLRRAAVVRGPARAPDRTTRRDRGRDARVARRAGGPRRDPIVTGRSPTSRTPARRPIASGSTKPAPDGLHPDLGPPPLHAGPGRGPFGRPRVRTGLVRRARADLAGPCRRGRRAGADRGRRTSWSGRPWSSAGAASGRAGGPSSATRPGRSSRGSISTGSCSTRAVRRRGSRPSSMRSSGADASFALARVALGCTAAAADPGAADVRPQELDPMVHVNNAVYADWLEEAVIAAGGTEPFGRSRVSRVSTTSEPRSRRSLSRSRSGPLPTAGRVASPRRTRTAMPTTMISPTGSAPDSNASPWRSGRASSGDDPDMPDMEEP